jgi:hypothetical protein
LPFARIQRRGPEIPQADTFNFLRWAGIKDDGCAAWKFQGWKAASAPLIEQIENISLEVKGFSNVVFLEKWLNRAIWGIIRVVQCKVYRLGKGAISNVS